jgi:transcriptional regulator with XRE-family HTH domain
MIRSSEPAVAQLGQRIRKERTRQGLSLKDVERRAGISPTHISEIERGRSSPTVGALVRIARALERPLAHFVEASPPPPLVFGSRADRREWFMEGGKARLESLLDPACDFDLSIIELFLEPRAILDTRRCCPGVREIFAYAIDGELEVRVGGEVKQLAAGDSIHIPGSLGECFSNAGTRTVRVYLVTFPRMRF